MGCSDGGGACSARVDVGSLCLLARLRLCGSTRTSGLEICVQLRHEE